MPFTGADVIEEAREKYREFTGQQTPDRTAMNALNRYIRRMFWRLQEVNPDRDTATQTIQFPLTTFDAGEALTAPDQPVWGGTITFLNTNQENELTIVPWRNRLRPGQGPAAWIKGGTIFFVGEEEDWNEVDTVVLEYAPEPVLLTTESDPVDLPDQAKEACVDYVAKFMARRGPATLVPREVVLEMKDDLRVSQDEMLRQVSKQHRRKTFVVREVW